MAGPGKNSLEELMMACTDLSGAGRGGAGRGRGPPVREGMHSFKINIFKVVLIN